VPISPADGERLIAEIVERLIDSEAELLRVIARRLARGINEPGWADAKLLELQALRRDVTTILIALEAEMQQAVGGAVAGAQNVGAAAALAEAERLLGSEQFPGGRAIAALLGESTGQVVPADIWASVLRSVEDAYRRVVAEASSTVLAGANTRLTAAQSALDRLNRMGVTSFTDRAGRRWGLASYVEMAVRTATGRAAVDGYLAGLNGTGLDLVYVSDSPRECPLCRPWEGKVLSVSGGTVGLIQARSVTDERTIRVRVDGTVAQARAAGLMHPNCRHRMTAYLPGATTINRSARAEPKGYVAQQRQREIERTIRAWKLRQAGALDPAAAARAGRKVREWQAVLRQHLASNPALKRQPQRERVGTAR
jgi:hypothetical protein